MKQILLIVVLLMPTFLFAQCTLTFRNDFSTIKRLVVNNDELPPLYIETLINEDTIPPDDNDPAFGYHTIADTIKSVPPQILNKVKNYIVANCGNEFYERTKLDFVLYSPMDSLSKYYPKIVTAFDFKLRYLLVFHAYFEPKVLLKFKLAINSADSIVSLPPFHLEKDFNSKVSICKAFSNIQKQFPDKALLEIESINLFYDWVRQKTFLLFVFSNLINKKSSFTIGCNNYYNKYSIRTDLDTGNSDLYNETESQLCID